MGKTDLQTTEIQVEAMKVLRESTERIKDPPQACLKIHKEYSALNNNLLLIWFFQKKSSS